MQDPVAALERTWEFCRRVEFSSDSAKLPSSLLEPVAGLLGAEKAIFRVFSSTSLKPVVLAGLEVPNSVHDAYLDRYFRLDPIGCLLARRFGGPLFSHRGEPGRWVDGCADTAGKKHRVIASINAQYRVNFRQYRTEFLSPHDLWHHLGVCFQNAASNRTVLLNFMRGRQSPPFDRLAFAEARLVGTLLHARADRYIDAFNDECSECADTVHRKASRSEDCALDGIDRRLSARELEVAEAVALGLTNKEVSDVLSISVRTVENHMRSIFAKLKINTRTRLAARLHEIRSRSVTRRSIE
jgi:DNA-binding CsgD family transcriptional regulator